MIPVNQKVMHTTLTWFYWALFRTPCGIIGDETIELWLQSHVYTEQDWYWNWNWNWNLNQHLSLFEQLWTKWRECNTASKKLHKEIRKDFEPKKI